MFTYPEIDPVIFSIGFVKIRWYGLMYVIGFVIAWWLARNRALETWSIVKPKEVDDLIFYCMLGVILGGRLGYVFFYGWDNLMADPLYIVKITEGGMSFHGGLAGVMIAMWLFARKLGVRMWGVWDFVAPLAPLGLFFGRIGNFINGELWGKPTDVPWAFKVGNQVLHPSMLYEAIAGGASCCLPSCGSYSAKATSLHFAVSGLFPVLLRRVSLCWSSSSALPDTDLGIYRLGLGYDGTGR